MDLKKLQNKTIGIVGLGYVGNNIHKFLQNRCESLNCKIIVCDKHNFKETILSNEFDFIINAAGNSGDFRNDFFETIHSNLILLEFILKNAKINDTLVVLSSTRIYGFQNDNQVIFNEEYCSLDNHKNLDYIYNGTKKLLESIAINYNNKVKYKIVIDRLSNLYGHFDELNDATFIKKVIRCIKDEKVISTNQNPLSTKDYIHVLDAIEGIISSMINSKKYQIFNIASGNSYSLADIARYYPIKFDFMKQPQEPVFSNISISRAKHEFDFNPKYNILKHLT